MAGEISESKRRVVERLKVAGQATAAEVAEHLGLTDVAVRQHLHALRALGMVASRSRGPRGRGRPSTVWSLTEESRRLFPDRHGDLTAALLRAARDTFGDEGVERLLAARGAEQVRRYRERMPADASVLSRVVELARLRTAEGYMAEAVEVEDGSVLLVEHHCPICDAARSCLGLCVSELHVFRHTLGDDVEVERTHHLLTADDRCVYRITPRRGDAAEARSD